MWIRRLSPTQRIAVADSIKSHELIDNDCSGAVSALFDTCFRGTWISSVSATLEASNKIYQLNVARECGFRVPHTLVSQSKSEVVEFTEHHAGMVIVKPVVGMTSRFLLTRRLERPEAISAEAFQRCPAIYQEYIPGTRHIRLNCFGDRSFAAAIDTAETDSRPNLSVPYSIWPVPDPVHARVRKVLDALHLAMGVVDLKETPSGDLVWFEVNPQGQFLFLEPLTGLKLSQHFADYLLSEWKRLAIALPLERKAQKWQPRMQTLPHRVCWNCWPAARLQVRDVSPRRHSLGSAQRCWPLPRRSC